MQALSMPARSPAIALWSSRIGNAMLLLFLGFDSIIKIMQHPQAVGPTTELGYAVTQVAALGILELACLLLYIAPRTSILGAIALTGYLGGAVATHVRAGSEPFSIVFPVILGTILWGVLYARDARVRALLMERR